jgi:hypothetical protein
MTVSFLALTDTDEIRSAIGVDLTDLTDDIIVDRKPEEDLESDLLMWVPTYATIISEGVTGTPTTAQRLKFLKLKIYARYFLSAIVTSSGINSILQKKSDGANEAIRYTNVKLSELTEALYKRADQAKADLLYLIAEEDSTIYSPFGTAPPAYDPVTNE